MLHVSDQPARLTALGQEHRTQGMMGNEGVKEGEGVALGWVVSDRWLRLYYFFVCVCAFQTAYLLGLNVGARKLLF